jgi:hypothetical protein
MVSAATSLMLISSASAQGQADHKAHHPEAARASAKSKAIIAKPVVAKDTKKMMSGMHEK